MATPQRKKCSSCGKRLRWSQFYTNPNTSDGLDTRCKDCLKEYAVRTRHKRRKRKRQEGAERLDEILANYNPGIQADKLAKRIPKRIIPRIVTECRNPRAFSHNGEMVIKSYHDVERCPYCNHSNYLVRTGYERTN